MPLVRVRAAALALSLLAFGPVLAQGTRALGEAKADKAVASALSKLEAQLPLSAGDRAALKTAARQRKVELLRVCGDPGNMPLSNDKLEGYQNKIVDIVASSMGAKVAYYWRPYTERGLTRQTFDASECDVLLDMPTGYERLITTEPIYRTTYVLASRADRKLDIRSLDDPVLKGLRIGVFQTSGIRQALTKHGLTNVVVHTIAHDADVTLEHQPWRQVQQVVDGKIDVAAVWGPFAGWLKAQGAAIDLRPVNLMDDEVPLEFDLSIGLRSTDQILRYKFEVALEERKEDIEKVLRAYGVPLVQCSRCYVAGDLPAHGVYTKPIPEARPVDPEAIAPDQRVTRERVENWLKDGADKDQELANAVLAGDVERVRFIAAAGGGVDKLDAMGAAPLHLAAKARNIGVVTALLDLKASIDLRDGDGRTALVHSIMRDDEATVRLLAARGADLARKDEQGISPLALAIVEDRFAAAMALIAAGAPLGDPSGPDGLTPLMLAAGKEPLQLTLGAGRRPIEKSRPDYPGNLEIARALIEKKADVNATSRSGLTALMLAAAHGQAPVVGLLLQSGADPAVTTAQGRTALDLAKANNHDTVVSMIRLLQQSGNN